MDHTDITIIPTDSIKLSEQDKNDIEAAIEEVTGKQVTITFTSWRNVIRATDKDDHSPASLPITKTHR